MATITRPKPKRNSPKPSPSAPPLEPQLEDWAGWLESLRSRTSADSLQKLLAARTAPLAWAVELSPEVAERITQLDALARSRSRASAVANGDWSNEAQRWLADTAAEPAPNTDSVLETLAWCHALPALAFRIEADLWREMFAQLRGMAEDSAALSPAGDPLMQQLLAAELPLTLAHLFPQLEGCADLAEPGREAAAAGLTDLLDSDGVPHARCLPFTRALLACWTRAAALSSAIARNSSANKRRSKHTLGLGDDAEAHYSGLVRRAIGFSRYDGGHVFERAAKPDPCRELFRAALRLGGVELDRTLAARALAGFASGNRKAVSEPKLPEASVTSEWAAVAHLRSGWQREALQFTVDYHRSETQLELTAGPHRLLSGLTRTEVEVDGRPLRTEGDWEEVCWYTDKEVAYQELEITLEQGWRRQRQMLLVFTDALFWFVEVLLPPAKHDPQNNVPVAMQTSLPLAPGTSATQAGETRELRLKTSRHAANVLPLSLPEWKSDSSLGELHVRADEMLLTQRGRGPGLASSLLFDLNGPRLGRQLTWRQLTVGEDLEPVPPHLAVGYRAQAGHDQWIFYRSLAPVTRRTVLGQHINCECFASRFRYTGDLESLLEVE